MWELDHKESQAPKNWWFWTVVLEKTLERPLNCREIQPINLKGNQSWIFIRRTDDEAETPIFWSPDVKNRLIGKDPDAWKGWRREEKGTTENEMGRDGHDFEQTRGVGDGQGSLAAVHGFARVLHDWVTELNWRRWCRPLEDILEIMEGNYFCLSILKGTILLPWGRFGNFRGLLRHHNNEGAVTRSRR